MDGDDKGRDGMTRRIVGWFISSISSSFLELSAVPTTTRTGSAMRTSVTAISELFFLRSSKTLCSRNRDDNCQLGEKRTYAKLKKDSICWNGREHKAEENATQCKCNKYDFKCDFGYKRDQSKKLLLKMFFINFFVR